MKITKNHKVLAGLATIALAFSGLSLASDTAEMRAKWTSPGNCGHARAGYEQNTLKSYSYLTMPTSGGTFTNVFYPVNVDLIRYNPDFVNLQARIRDAASSERVKIYLKEMRVDTGLVYTRLILDSAQSADSTSPQMIDAFQWLSGWGFEDPNAIFFLDVRMYRSSTGGAPRIYGLSLSGDIG